MFLQTILCNHFIRHWCLTLENRYYQLHRHMRFIEVRLKTKELASSRNLCIDTNSSLCCIKIANLFRNYLCIILQYISSTGNSRTLLIFLTLNAHCFLHYFICPLIIRWPNKKNVKSIYFSIFHYTLVIIYVQINSIFCRVL